jgi:NhaP-type Na+/H+ or K+/H+ antiporter
MCDYISFHFADKIWNAVEKYGFWIGILIGFVLGLLYVWLMTYLNNNDAGDSNYQHMHSDCVKNR